MKVLMVSDVYFPRVNGVSSSIVTFRRELRQLGHEVVLVAPDYGRPSGEEEQVIRIPSWSVPGDREDRLMRMGQIDRLVPQFADAGFDMVHIQTPFVAHYAGLRLAEALGLPKVVTYHTYFEEYLHHYLPFLPSRLARWVARRYSRQQCNDVDGVIVPSSVMLNVLKDYGVENRFQVIPTGIQPERFRGGDGEGFRRRFNIPAQRPLLAFIGRVAFEKNIDFLLRMLAVLRHSVSDVLLVIAGEGPAMPHLRRLTQRLGLEGHVAFIGYQDRETTLLDLYRATDVFVFASRTETQGLVLLEALAMGTPVVSTAILGTRDILTHCPGALVAEEDEAAFAASVARVLTTPELKARLASSGKAVLRDWSAQTLARRLELFYLEVLADDAEAATQAACG